LLQIIFVDFCSLRIFLWRRFVFFCHVHMGADIIMSLGFSWLETKKYENIRTISHLSVCNKRTLNKENKTFYWQNQHELEVSKMKTFFVCNCFYTRNIYLKKYNIHVVYGTKQEFLKQFSHVIMIYPWKEYIVQINFLTE
jgi:hypothetical protein